ncbi:hypothetical protein N2152v2_009509 [Parachlorella kessleri]
MGGGPGHQARDVVERQQQTAEAAAGAGQQPRQHRDEERTEQQQHSGVEGASRIRTTSAEGHPVEALIKATVGSFGQSDVQPESVAVELSVGPDDTVAVNLAPVWEQDVNAAFRLDVGLEETLTVNLALAEEQHVASEAVTQEEEGDRAAQNMGQGFQAALPGYDAVDSFQQPLLNWRPAAGLGKATSAGAPGKQLPTGLQATRKQISPVARDAKVAASISGRLPPTKQANGSDGSPLPAVLPAGWVETTNAESDRERQGGYSASYGVADFTGLQGDSPVYEEVAPVEAPPPRKPVSKPSVSEILAKAGVKLKPKQEQGGPRTAPPRQQQTMSRGQPPQQQQWQQEGEGYSIAASWPPYEGARLPALSPDATYPPDGGMAASGPGLMPWNPAGVVYPGHYAAAYGVMPYGSSPMAAGAPSSAWYGPPVEAGGPYGNSLPPLPGSAAAAAAWMAGQAQYAGQQASWPAPTHAPMYDPRQQQPPQQQLGQQLYKAQGKVRPTVPRQHGVFIARPSKVFHGLQARSRHQPQKYQDDGRPAFSLK